MQSFVIRGGLAVAAVIAIAVTAAPQVRAQNTAAFSANPELAAQGEWNGSTTYVIDARCRPKKSEQFYLPDEQITSGALPPMITSKTF